MTELMQSRRAFLGRSVAYAAGFAGLQAAMARGALAGMASVAERAGVGFGPLVSDPAGVLNLPEGFRYTVISRVGELMDDGFAVPGRHDGMAAFPGPTPDTCVIVRNHENSRGGKNNPWSGRRPTPDEMAKVYDPAGGAPIPGGTTNLVFDVNKQELIGHHLSLVGTERNCAGGPTPRNTWITCEETVTVKRDGVYEQDHGYCFEVPAKAEPGLVEAKPIIGMGRFNHEACATSAAGIVYQTEDRHDGLIYRYIPKGKDDLLAGGKLQVLVIDGRPSLDTRNWNGQKLAIGERVACRWMDIDNVESPEDDLRYRGFEAGAARFARGEGMWLGEADGKTRSVPTIYWACTNGGPAKAGQIFKLELPTDPAAELADAAGTLELFIEPNDPGVLENADNITVSPFGDLIICEDGDGKQFLRGVTPEGELYTFAENALSDSEFAGAAFSPDGSTLFVNIQVDGMTLAITGPWNA